MSLFSQAKATLSGTEPENKKIGDLKEDIVTANEKPSMTTDWGQSISDPEHWLKAASNERTGPQLLEDQIAREKIHRFDHERIPERVVHARGAGAFGKFTLLESAEDVTHAKVLTDTSRETPVFLRFSTVQGSKGSADTVRDVRGFAVKFYTEEGNWDIVGNNIPVFFIQESIKFPDLVHAVKPEPHNEVPQGQSAHNNFWDFAFLHQEATHMFMWTMSDRAIPRSFRMMQGFGVNTFSLINAAGKRHFVKFHFKPELGVHSLVWDEALKLGGQDPDYHRKDLWEAIEKGFYPKWKFGLQTIPEEDQDKFDFDILDSTKLWPEDLVPVRYVGILELNRNVDNFFAQTEQVAFCTSHIVPGIDFSDDPLLQGRNFSYFDTQISRLGINWEQLPINRPVCPVFNFNRDGQGQHRIHQGMVNYWPNRFNANPPAQDAGFKSYQAKVEGIKSRILSDKFKDYLSQAQMFYNSLSPIERIHLTNAFSFELDHCDDPVVYQRLCVRLTEIDLNLAQAIAEKVGAPTPLKQTKPNPGHKAKNISQLDFMPEKPTIETRRIAILITEGYDSVSYEHIKSAIEKAGAFPFTIAPKRQEVQSSNAKSKAQPDHHFNGMRSTLFDAVVVPDGSHVQALKANGLARYYIREAFGHNKALGGIGKGNLLIEDALHEAKGVSIATSTNSDVTESYGVVTVGRVHPEDDAKINKALDEFTSAFFQQVSRHRCWARELDGLSGMVSC